MEKKFEIYYLPIAESDLEETFDYIRLDSPKSALNMINKIDNSILNLMDFPEIGIIPKDKKLKKHGYRVLIIENYLVFYVIKNNYIEIRRILHSKRNYRFLL